MPPFRSGWMIGALTVALCWALGPLSALAAEPPAHWIWLNASEPRAEAAAFRHVFEVAGVARAAELRGVAHLADAVIYLNGHVVAEVEGYDGFFTRDVASRLQPGQNVLAIAARNGHGPAAVFVELAATLAEGQPQVVSTGQAWQASARPAEGWLGAKFAGAWKPAADLGAVADRPWGRTIQTATVGKVDDYNQWKMALTGEGQKPVEESYFVVPGFTVEKVRAAGEGEGSWISLAIDPQGRLYIGREDQGVLRTVASVANNRTWKLETIDATLKECRGLLWAHDSLYAHANLSNGLFRLRDEDGDGKLDAPQRLVEITGGDGHGRNDLVLGADGKIYGICGDSVDLLTKCADRTSPTREAHRGLKTKEGYVYRVDRDGGGLELLLAGLRNPFGIDFHPAGELFTYDADAEYDAGAPWYRPTRVHNLMLGADYGWRGVTGSWPPYYCDQPAAAPPNIDIGQGSPTAVMFGTRSNFPPAYRQALFVLDWAYGRVLAVHLAPYGASYLGRAETFLKGRPLNVCDLEFGPDGAMYLVTGGRKTQSAIYRVRYTGRPQKPEETKGPGVQEEAARQHATQALERRRTIEGLAFRKVDQTPEGAVEDVWPHLDSPDPWIRYTARVALERLPVATWEGQVASDERPTGSLAGLLSLAQTLAGADDKTARQRIDVILARLAKLPWEQLAVSRRLMAVQAYELCLNRVGTPGPEAVESAVAARLAPLYPDRSPRMNQALSLVLSRLVVPDFVPKTLTLLDKAPTQAEQLHEIFVLRQAARGWTEASRDDYARWLGQLPAMLGGEGMPTFAGRIKADALAALNSVDRPRIEKLLAQANQPPPAPANRPLVKQWKPADLVPLLQEVGRDRDLARGKEMFTQALCIYCHRIGSTGGSVGPNLTDVAARFSRKDLLMHIMEPSQVVSEAYRTDVIVTHSGRVITGRIVPSADFRQSAVWVSTNPLRPDLVESIAKPDIESHTPSAASVMPTGLLSTLSRDEILDLLAYLERPVAK